MRGLFFLFIFGFLVFSPEVLASENFYSDEIVQLKHLNSDLNQQLSVATQELTKLQTENSNVKITEDVVQELDKARRSLATQSSEIQMLREKLMIFKDYAFNGK